MLGSLRSFFDVWFFIIARLSRPSFVVTIVSLVIVAGGGLTYMLT